MNIKNLLDVLESRNLFASIGGQLFNDLNLSRTMDENETPLAGVAVFIDADGDGKFDSGEKSTVSDDNGNYRFSNIAAGTYDVLAVLPEGNFATTPTKFGTLVGGFEITLNFTSEMTPTQQAAFVAAADRWQSIITADLPDYNTDTEEYGVIDDVVINASIEPIDGPGRILGSAGPSGLREDSNIPYLGAMRFDTSDVKALEQEGSLQAVIQHEMGHVLGFGTIWEELGLLDTEFPGNPRFTGANATREYNALFDNDALDVPVEAGGGPGTALGHWRETDFDVEQMTGYAAAGGVFMPISRVSVGALEDMGYNVNYDAADGYDPKTQTGTAWQPTNVGVRPYSYRVTVTSTQENLNLDFGTRGNTAPQLRNFNITPTPPETDSVITISTRAVDAEGDAIAAVTFYRETNGVTGLQSDDQYIVQRTKARRGLFTALVATNGLKPGEQTFYVVASDSLGASRRRTGAVTLVAPVPPPARPRELIVKAPGSDTAVLSWNAPSDNNARYRVEVSTSFTFARETIVQTFNTKPNATTATVKGLDASTIYYYRVRAFNSGGTSSYSAPANLRQPVFGEIVVDNLSSRFSTKGNWTAATSPTSYGPNYSTATSSGVGDVTSASFGLRLEKAQRYMLYIWWPAALENGGAVDVSVKTGDQKFVTTVDQSQRGGGWVLLDIFNFAAGRGSVTLSSATGGSIAADAIRLLPAG